MNILIINAFGTSPKGKYRFDSFCNLIKKLFLKISKGSAIDNFNFICRTTNNISEFLYKYDMISGDVNENKKHKKNFDKIDIVIIDGYEKYAPWTNKSFILCEFIKLCKMTNKILYAGGVALEILIYYLATGSLNEYNFVNAKGQIKALEEMTAIPNKYKKELKNNDNFLDFVTGDILEYKNNESWIPIKNIGLHKQMVAEKYMNRGKFVLPYNFKGKDYIKNENAFVTVCNEIKVRITRHYLQHYLVDKLPLEFIAVTSLTWFPHFFNVNNQALQFKVLCESDKGPIVIEHQNSTGVLFHINEKYQETVIFMENFIRNKFNEVQNKVFKFKNENNNNLIKNEKNEKSDIPLIFKTYNSYKDIKKPKLKSDDVIINGNNTNLDRVNNSRAFNRIKNIKSEASHVGFGINNRDMIFVENNYVSQRPLFYMDNNIKNEDTQLNMENILSHKIKRKSNNLEPKNTFINFENQKNNNIKKLKNLQIKIYNDNKEKKIKNKNMFMSYNHKTKIHLKNNKDINFYNNKFCMHSNNLNQTKKKKIRMNSANIFHKTINKKKAKTYSNLEYLGMYPLISNKSENINKRNNNMKNNDIDYDDKYDVYIPKYPRPANTNIENRLDTSKNNLNLLLLSSIKDNYDNNSYNIVNNKIGNKKLKFNSINPRNITSFNSFNENKKINIKTIFY